LADDRVVLVTLVADDADVARVGLLVDSIRSFGGDLSDGPIWVFVTPSIEVPRDAWTRQAAHAVPLNGSVPVRDYPFTAKVAACARAERMTSERVRSLVWIDPGCLVVAPPRLFALDDAADAAVRPVHIQNVGLQPHQPLDDFWRGVYAAAGLSDVPSTVETFVDGRRLRAYFNSHAFAVNPARGLLRRWAEVFGVLVDDEAYQRRGCQDERHRVFLHQAVLSALLIAELGPDRIRVLPPDYNYPYNLHRDVPAERRASSLGKLVCLAYEDRPLHPDLVADIAIDDALDAWLRAHLERETTETHGSDREAHGP